MRHFRVFAASRREQDLNLDSMLTPAFFLENLVICDDIGMARDMCYISDHNAINHRPTIAGTRSEVSDIPS